MAGGAEVLPAGEERGGERRALIEREEGDADGEGGAAIDGEWVERGGELGEGEVGACGVAARGEIEGGVEGEGLLVEGARGREVARSERGVGADGVDLAEARAGVAVGRRADRSSGLEILARPGELACLDERAGALDQAGRDRAIGVAVGGAAVREARIVAREGGAQAAACAIDRRELVEVERERGVAFAEGRARVKAASAARRSPVASSTEPMFISIRAR